ncbi:MAG TPA: LysM peptidoglycan-binding domain-containing protein [Gemmatimonadaceae bacterium]|nr:LysM peptidoglycan-binding domain-containing protein [Gemmatimonadaceae bacterium]
MRVLSLTFNRAPRVIAVAAVVALAGAFQTAGAQDQRKPAPTFTNSTPLAADEVEHVVKKGDTLWDIAKAFLKDPFKWPEVFSRNSDIVEDAHWIYPGENIRIPRGEVKPEVLARIDTKPAVPGIQHTVFAVVPGMYSDRVQSDGSVMGRAGSYGVSRGEIDSAPFGDRKGGPSGAGRLAAAYDRPGIAAPDGERRFQLHDRVFVKMPAGVAAFSGQLLLTYRLGEEISDNAQLVIPTGIVRVESQQPGQPALASIVRQFDEMRLGQPLMLLAETMTTPGVPVPVAAGQSEKVIYISGNNVLPSLQSYVVLTSRLATSVRVGDRFTLIDDSVDPRYPAPPVPAAVAEVVKVTPFAVTAIVIDQDQPRIRTGMTARLTARMP